MDLDYYRKHGWLHIPNAVPKEHLDKLRTIGLEMRRSVGKHFGSSPTRNQHLKWNGIVCASNYNQELLEVYKSKYMRDIAVALLETDEIRTFNDQIVYKLPFDGLRFKEHFDNALLPDTGKQLRTVNLSIILDDFTEENGAIYVRDGDGLWHKIFPKAGSIVCFEGYTVHRSPVNKGKEPRGLYACVYKCAKEDWEMEGHHNELFTAETTWERLNNG